MHQPKVSFVSLNENELDGEDMRQEQKLEAMYLTTSNGSTIRSKKDNLNGVRETDYALLNCPWKRGKTQ